MNGATYRIVRLQAENVKRLRAIDITPTDDVVIVAGENEQGKTSVLDSIMFALGGKANVQAEPLRRGERKGRVTIDCGEFTATREFTPDGQKLILKDKEGNAIKPAQTFLDDLIGSLSFDPLSFSRMKGPERLSQLLALTEGLEDQLAEIATDRQRAYDDRRDLNRDAARYEAQLEGMEKPHDDWQTEPVDVRELINEKDGWLTGKRDYEAMTHKLADLKQEEIRRIERRDALRRQLEQAERDLAEAAEARAKQERVLAKIDADGFDAEIAKLDERIANAVEINRKVEVAKAFSSILKSHVEATLRAKLYTEHIEELDQQKRELLESANLPVPGLSFADEEVLFDGYLFDQLSHAQQLKISLAMAMALNPGLRVIRITDGSLLDNKSMEIVRQMAHDGDYQIWIECVGEREDATVVIEDGAVKVSG